MPRLVLIPFAAIFHMEKLIPSAIFQKQLETTEEFLIIPRPGYSKKKKYPVLYLLHGIGGDEKEWLNGGHPEISWIISMRKEKLNP